MFKKHSQEELKILNSSNILEVAASIGISVSSRVDGKGYQRAVTADGKPLTKLAFNGSQNSFYDFERSEGGNPLNLLMTWGGKSFLESIEYLKTNNFSKSSAARANFVTPERKPFAYNFQISRDKTNLKNYLINERKISSALVDKMLQVRLIDQDVKKNILFHYKKDSDIVGAVVQGTYINHDRFGKRGTFKQTAENSESNFGFHFSFGHPSKLYVFEAPIDALSYYTLNPEARRDVMYGAMAGFKPEAISNFVSYARRQGNENITKDGIYISTDNDTAGIKFWTNYEYYNSLNQGERIFHNNIPDFYSVPRSIYQMYQEAAAKYGVDIDLKPLLATHKYETNFSTTDKKLANAFKSETGRNESYFKFFGEKPTVRASELTSEALQGQIDELVGQYLRNNLDLKKTLHNPDLSDSANQNFLNLVSRLGEDYQDRMVIKDEDEIQKDWNDVLKKNVARLSSPGINVSNAHEMNEALKTVDYHQIAPENLKAAGIHHRADIASYEEKEM